MSMNDKERLTAEALECLIDLCNEVIEKYRYTIEQHGYDYQKPQSYFEAWDDFVDALETIEDQLR
jgi:CYTH domain-containing protein